MTAPVVLGVDIGTTSTKVVAFEPAGTVVSSAGGGYPLDALAALSTSSGTRRFLDADDPELRVAMDDLLTGGGELVICGSHHLVGHLRAALLGAEADALALSDPLTR